MIQLAGGLQAEFLDLGLDSGWESMSAFFLGLPGSLFLLEIAKKIVIKQWKITAEIFF